MLSDLVFWLGLAVELALTAGIVVTASVVTERAGPLIGALVMTLPVTVWPAYLFLALDHDKAFLAESAVGGLAVNSVNGIFMVVYAALARRRSLAISLLVAWHVGLSSRQRRAPSPGVCCLPSLSISSSSRFASGLAAVLARSSCRLRCESGTTCHCARCWSVY